MFVGAYLGLKFMGMFFVLEEEFFFVFAIVQMDVLYFGLIVCLSLLELYLLSILLLFDLLLKSIALLRQNKNLLFLLHNNQFFLITPPLIRLLHLAPLPLDHIDIIQIVLF